MTRDRILGALALLAMFVAPLVLVYDFFPAATSSVAPALPLDTIVSLKAAMFTIALVVGGGTMVYLIYIVIRNSELLDHEPREMPPGWKQGAFITWIAIVAGLVAVAVLMSAGTIGATADAPDLELEMTVTVSSSHPQWNFENEHLGVRRAGQLTVPVDTLVHLEISSGDVMHNLAIHEMGVKQHAIPGQQTHAWFVAEETGEYDIVCTELCGENHSRMTGTLIVLDEDEYGDFIEELTGDRPFDGGDRDGD